MLLNSHVSLAHQLALPWPFLPDLPEYCRG
ncbi:hypothetical protein SAMN02745831_07472 [Streptomyces sp. PgraA7]|nr:hypothetical protein SAMN02745831_07472 [Streptomyces sp. PgraA7]